MTRVTRIAYKGWPNCYQVSNGLVELIVTTDVGPRLIRFGFPIENELAEFPADLGRMGGSEFRMYGGHRLWHAPESQERTYYPDNSPVTLEPGTDGVRVNQPTEATTGIQADGDMLELESLGPLTRVDPEGMVEHVESWFLWRGVPVPSGDDDVDGCILPKVRQILSCHHV